MAKLTPEQKAQNKIHTKARDAAFRERKRAYDDAVKKAEADLRETAEHKRMVEACERSEASLTERNRRRREIEEQIKVLQEQIKSLEATLGVPDLNAARIETNRAFYQLKAAKMAEVAAQFPDVANLYSAAQWEALGHYNNNN